ncbi:MAG: hypothetical protein OQL11_13890 [Gammaproteobacteria bacterium]|nr:hypothetical protein [Gammaproteobacteria bacterium]
MHTETVASGRPGWVWAISIFFGVSAGWTLLSFALIRSGAVTLNAAQIAYFDSLSPLDYIFSIGIGLANLLGAISLLLLRKIAFYLFASALVANLLMTLWHIAAKGWVAAIGDTGLVGAIIGLGLLVIVCVYSRRLLKRGVLR